jgi:hypothetical protein
MLAEMGNEREKMRKTITKNIPLTEEGIIPRYLFHSDFLISSGILG